MTLQELITKTQQDIKHCEAGEKRFAKAGEYLDAIKIKAMAKAYEKILWQLKKINP